MSTEIEKKTAEDSCIAPEKGISENKVVDANKSTAMPKKMPETTVDELFDLFE